MALGSGTLPQSMSEHAVAWPSEPYKGLEFFSSTDVPLFSQREDDIEDCAARIDDFTTRVLILHGLSGMGKSSFLRAGLIPRLEDPPGDGSRFHFLRDGAGAPYIIRTTDDPVSRLREALRITASADGRLPARTAHEIQDILKVPASADTVESGADQVIHALRSLAGSQGTRILAVVFDQAEEVLTLTKIEQAPGVNAAKRLAFFYLLEEICQLNLDLKIVISLRTEYYGQFCSFFSDAPAYRITSEASPLSGIRDYYLQPIRKEKQIIGIIKRPTLDQPIGAMSAPRETYGFEYAPGVAETIARDLSRLSGDSSILPVLQVVCRKLYEGYVRAGDSGQGAKARDTFVIEDKHYREIGGVEGALDSYIDAGIRSSIRIPGRAPSPTPRSTAGVRCFAISSDGRKAAPWRVSFSTRGG